MATARMHAQVRDLIQRANHLLKPADVIDLEDQVTAGEPGIALMVMVWKVPLDNMPTEWLHEALQCAKSMSVDENVLDDLAQRVRQRTTQAANEHPGGTIG